MNAKSILFVVAIAASANTFAAGRDTVSPDRGTTSLKVFSKSVAAVQGRDTIAAKDLPAPMSSTRHAIATTDRFGRA